MAADRRPIQRTTAVTRYCEVCGGGIVMPEVNARHQRALGIPALCAIHDPHYTGHLPKWARDKRAAYLAANTN